MPIDEPYVFSSQDLSFFQKPALQQKIYFSIGSDDPLSIESSCRKDCQIPGYMDRYVT